MTDLALRLLLLLRLLCFMALVYLGLHAIFARLISRPDSKVLWFFSILTAPLTRPVRACMALHTPEPQVRFVALVVYGVLWVLLTVVTQSVISVPR
jgi:hypothetical protein